MTIAKLYLPEFDRENVRTRRILAALPANLYDWQPHEKLHTLGWNANHIVDIFAWIPSIINESEFDMNPVDGPAMEISNLADPSELLARFDSFVADARPMLESVSDETLAEPWSLKSAGQVYFTISKEECVRTWVLNHVVHHRAILSVGMRMAGVELVPAYDE